MVSEGLEQVALARALGSGDHHVLSPADPLEAAQGHQRGRTLERVSTQDAKVLPAEKCARRRRVLDSRAVPALGLGHEQDAECLGGIPAWLASLASRRSPARGRI